MPGGAVELRQFINYWLILQRANGFHQRLIDQWIGGKPDLKQTPRWSVLWKVLGWESN